MDILKKVFKLEKDSEEFGFCWEHPQQIIEQIQSECLEVQEHLDSDNPLTKNADLQEEIGDLIHAVFSLCVFCDFDIQETIEISLDKFEQRMLMVRKIAHEKGLSNLQGVTFIELMQYWDSAKARLSVLKE